jgi:hypothetical protein
MDVRTRLALAAAIVLTLPATFAIAAGALRAAMGIGGPAALVDAFFTAFGVSNASPLPVRQAWYFGAYILAPAAAAAAALSAATALRAHGRRPLYAVTAVAALSAMFWVVYSLADA